MTTTTDIDEAQWAKDVALDAYYDEYYHRDRAGRTHLLAESLEVLQAARRNLKRAQAVHRAELADPVTPVVLYVGGSSSSCGACGRSCDPFEKVHTKAIGYRPEPGCGARYTHVVSTYLDLRDPVSRMRPDLLRDEAFAP